MTPYDLIRKLQLEISPLAQEAAEVLTVFYGTSLELETNAWERSQYANNPDLLTPETSQKILRDLNRVLVYHTNAQERLQDERMKRVRLKQSLASLIED